MRESISIFDFDGTLVKGDTFVDFIFYLVRKRWVVTMCTWPIIFFGSVLQISNLTCTFGLKIILHCLTFGYDAKAFQCAAGDFSRYWIHKNKDTQNIEPTLRDLKSLISNKQKVIIATGSISLWVEPILKEILGVSPEVLGSVWQEKWFGIGITRRCFRSEKLKMLEEQLQSPLKNHRAFGNSIHDRWFLESASEIYVVQPGADLRSYLKQNRLKFNEISSL